MQLLQVMPLGVLTSFEPRHFAIRITKHHIHVTIRALIAMATNAKQIQPTEFVREFMRAWLFGLGCIALQRFVVLDLGSRVDAVNVVTLGV